LRGGAVHCRCLWEAWGRLWGFPWGIQRLFGTSSNDVLGAGGGIKSFLYSGLDKGVQACNGFKLPAKLPMHASCVPLGSRFPFNDGSAPHFRLVAPVLLRAVLLVCEACPVSVAARPERLSVSGATRDSGHHSRFVPFALLLAAAARGIGVDGAVLLEVGPSSEPLTQGSEGRRVGAALHRARREQA
jgi:hypothetical protein